MFVLLEENKCFNDVTQFEMHEQSISNMQKVKQTNGDKSGRKSVEV